MTDRQWKARKDWHFKLDYGGSAGSTVPSEGLETPERADMDELGMGTQNERSESILEGHGTSEQGHETSEKGHMTADKRTKLTQNESSIQTHRGNSLESTDFWGRNA